MGLQAITGDANADVMLQLILARLRELPESLIDDILKGVHRVFFPFAGITFHTKLTRDQISPALECLRDQGFLRGVELEGYGHGVHVRIAEKIWTAT